MATVNGRVGNASLIAATAYAFASGHSPRTRQQMTEGTPTIDWNLSLLRTSAGNPPTLTQTQRVTGTLVTGDQPC